MKTAIAIRHVAFEDLGSLAEVLRQQNYLVNYVEVGLNDLNEIDPLEPDLVVILGGPIGAYQEQDYPFLLSEMRLLERRLAADLPTLGICLGAQIMARVLGAKVYPGSEKEIGWSSIELSDAGRQSPLAYLASENSAVLHWHGDTFNLPTGSIHLASSAKYQNQAFAWGKCGLALQFHPEVTARGLEQWFIGHAGEISSTPGINLSKLRQDTACYAEALANNASKFWQAWLHNLENSNPTNLTKSVKSL